MAKDNRPSFKRKKKRTKLKAIIALLVALGLAERLDYGMPRIIDGDTIELGDKKIRLYGIDAFEESQSCIDQDGQDWECGKESTRYLKKIVADDKILCIRVHKNEHHTDKYRRFVSICYNSDFKSINAAMVKTGHAVAFKKYSNFYLEEERKAQEKKIGVWSGEFESPDEYRKDRKNKAGNVD